MSRIQNSNLFQSTSFTIDNGTNLLKSVTLNGKTIAITQNFLYYNSETGIKDRTKTASGAYLFRPSTATPEEVAANVIKLNAFSGDIVDEFHQVWTSTLMNIRQSIKVYKDEGYIEFDWIVGNIAV